MRKKSREWFNEFTVLGVFAAVACLGFLYAGMSLVFTMAAPPSSPVARDETSSTVAAYQIETRTVLAPLLAQSAMMTSDDIPEAGPAFSALLQKTGERLLGMRVPSSMRDAHLTFVLLVEQWKRAAAGSPGDQDVVLARTRDVAEANPWLLESETSL